MPSTRKTVAAGAVTAAVASGAAYLDRRYGLSRDIKHIRQDKQFVKLMGQRIGELGNNVTIYHMIELADQNAPALWFEGRSWTYAELKMDIDKFAAILEHRGVSMGDNVAVFMTNSPEMIIAYVALAKLGAIPAMVNNSLRSLTLEHCLEIASAELIICSPDLASAVLTVYEETSESAPCISFNLLSFASPSLNPAHKYIDRITQIRYEDLAAASPSLTPLPYISIRDTGVLMYTSGTTGKPKAVNLKHFVLVAVSTPHPRDVSNKSLYHPIRMFSCMPLFHASCLYVGFYSTMGSGGTFCLGRKFSATTFTQELVASRATRMLYVGELCRYILRTPESKYDKAHSVIVATGNGMAKDVWEKFKERFGVPEIREFYRSTEGKAKFDIMSRSSAAAGSVGFEGPIRRYYEGDTFLVKYDPVTEAPYRDPETGFCVKTKADEPGEAIGRVLSMDFYAEYLNDPAANNAKLMTNVFAKDDVFQRTGDILVRDKKGWIHFLDRTGDTYRWRGENVSAGEVREHITRIPGVADVAVFGIKLEGYDGQAGAAGISLQDSSPQSIASFMTILYPSLKTSGLTTYQIPRLVRITNQLDTNATFKHAKEVMKSRPWDPNPAVQTNKDALYWLNLNSEAYEILDEASWAEIKSARARL